MNRLRCLSTVLPVVVAACYADEPPNTAQAIAAAPPIVVEAAPVAAAAAPVPSAPVAVAAAALLPGAQALALTIQPPTPEAMAPPPVARLPAMVSLPVLPHPSKYPRLPAAPYAATVTECGSAWDGVEWMPLECLDEDAEQGGRKAAKVVIPYGLMKPTAAALPKLVDHRADGTEGPIRKQGGDQCSAFAFTAALDHAYARWTGKPGAFSVMQVWGRYHGTSEGRAIEGNLGDPVSAEADFAYDGVVATSWRRCHAPPAKQFPAGTCGQPVDIARLAPLDAQPVAEITQIEVIPRSELGVLREKLAAGQDVVVGIKLHSFATGGELGAKYLVADENGKPKEGIHGHSILLAGYAITPNGVYYLVHNSFGLKWGDNGYAWMHEDVLKAYSVNQDMVVPDVQPKEIANRRLQADGSLAAKCAAGMVPDSISGQCAGRCPDGSPRHNNVCAAPKSDCPAGAVNLTGSCVLAAPPSSGVDPSSQIRWTCGAGGCSYDVPQGQLNCRAGACAVSCPAPSFRLATTLTGLACVE
jgi:hypothetical protein